MKRLALAALAAFLPFTSPAAAASCQDDAMIVLDGSGSMARRGFTSEARTRIAEARSALHDTLPLLDGTRRVGLLTYGPGSAQACTNFGVRIAPRAGAVPDILNEIDALTPSGDTPLTASVERAAEALDYRNRAATIVVVTDGKESCGGYVCQSAAALAEAGANLVVHVIAIERRQSRLPAPLYTRAPDCLAERTGGQVHSVYDARGLVTALNRTLSCPLFSALSETTSRG